MIKVLLFTQTWKDRLQWDEAQIFETDSRIRAHIPVKNVVLYFCVMALLSFNLQRIR